MRSLSLWKLSNVSLTEAEFSSSTEASGSLTAVAVDLDQNALLLTTENRSSSHEGGARVELWLLPEENELDHGVCPSVDPKLL